MSRSWDGRVFAIPLSGDREPSFVQPQSRTPLCRETPSKLTDSAETEKCASAPGNIKKGVVVFSLILSLMLLPTIYGQADRARISGIVTDRTQAVIPGVEVTALNIDTGVRTTGSTNQVGNYSLVNLPIGTYTIRFSLPGFKTFERTGFSVTAGQMARLDVVLELGEPIETVVVTANAELLNRENTQLAKTMQTDVITDLPLTIVRGRSIQSVAFATVAGVEGDPFRSYIAGSPASGPDDRQALPRCAHGYHEGIP